MSLRTGEEEKVETDQLCKQTEKEATRANSINNINAQASTAQGEENVSYWT